MTKATMGSADSQLSLRQFFLLVTRDCTAILGVLVTIILVSSLAIVAAPLLFSTLIDGLVGGQLQYPLMGFVAYAVIVGFNRASSVVKTNLVKNVEQRAIFHSSVHFFTRITKNRPDFYLNYNPAQLNEVLRNAQMSLRMYINLLFQVLVPGLLEVIISIYAVSIVINSQVAIIIGVYGASFIVLTVLSNHYSKPFQEKAVGSTHKNVKFLGNVINAVETIRVNKGLSWVIDRFKQGADNAKSHWIKFYWTRLTFGLIQALALTVQVSITYFLLLPEFSAKTLSIGDLVLFNMLLLQLNRPFELIGTSLEEAMVANTLLHPLKNVLQEPSDDDDADENKPDGISVSQADGVLKFSSVSFSYGDNAAIKRLSFSAKRGRLNFLIGKSGAGKSTIFKLALKMAVANEGEITYNGQDVRSYAADDLYDIVSVVPQDTILLNDSIRNNIAMGHQCSDEQLYRAIDHAGLTQFIHSLPNGLDMNCGERGLRLSGGERQRISLARALLRSPKFLLLDEASSALDEKTEVAILNTLRNLAPHITILAITHRINTIQPDDHIIDLCEAHWESS